MRLFFAFEVPARQLRSVEEVAGRLRDALPTARFTSPGAWHVTLRFLGEVTDDRLEKMIAMGAAAASSARPATARLEGIGAFPGPSRPRVLWVGVRDEDGALAALAADLERRARRARFDKEVRPWRPHLTLARFRVPARPGPTEGLFHQEAKALDTSAFTVEELVLFRSHLSPRGAAYEAVARTPLGGG